MDVVWHYHEMVKVVVDEMTVTDRCDHHCGDFGSSEVGWADICIGEETIHGQEGSACPRRLGEGAICRQAAVQTPGDEYWPPNGLEVGQTAGVQFGHVE